MEKIGDERRAWRTRARLHCTLGDISALRRMHERAGIAADRYGVNDIKIVIYGNTVFAARPLQ
jgi:hypothetical protein